MIKSTELHGNQAQAVQAPQTHLRRLVEGVGGGLHLLLQAAGNAQPRRAEARQLPLLHHELLLLLRHLRRQAGAPGVGGAQGRHGRRFAAHEGRDGLLVRSLLQHLLLVHV